MSQENLEIVRSAIRAYNRGDWETALNYADPEAKLDLSRAVGPQHGVFGLDQIKLFWAELADSWESVQIEPRDFIEAGEHVVVPWTVHARGRAGIEVVSRVTWVWTIRHGAVERMSMYQELEEALEAVALSE